MNAIQIKLIIETKEMRRLQKEYFRVRSNYILNKCKNQEKMVDMLLHQVISEDIIFSESPPATEIIQANFKFPDT